LYEIHDAALELNFDEITVGIRVPGQKIEQLQQQRVLQLAAR